MDKLTANHINSLRSIYRVKHFEKNDFKQLVTGYNLRFCFNVMQQFHFVQNQKRVRYFPSNWQRSLLSYNPAVGCRKELKMILDLLDSMGNTSICYTKVVSALNVSSSFKGKTLPQYGSNNLAYAENLKAQYNSSGNVLKDNRLCKKDLSDVKIVPLRFLPSIINKFDTNNEIALCGNIKLDNYLLTTVNKKYSQPHSIQTFILSVILFYLYRMNDYNNFTYFQANSNQLFRNKVSKNISAKFIPILFEPEEPFLYFTHVYKYIFKKNQFIDGVYNMRNICLHDSKFLDKQKPMPVAIDFVENLANYSPPRNIKICFAISLNDRKINIYKHSSLGCSDLISIIMKNISLHIKRLFATVLENNNRKITEISILTNYEYSKFIVDYNRTETNYPREKAIHHIFEEQVLKYPDNIALEFRGTKLTYRKVNQMADRYAKYLKGRGVQAGDLIGIAMERSIDLIVGILAILKAGGAYVPIDPNYPDTRIRYMLDDTNTSHIITNNTGEAKLKDIRLEGKSIQIINMERLRKELKQFDNTRLHNTSISSDLCYVIYTSGSTGNPKGVAIEHKSVIRLVKNTNYINITPNDCIPHASSSSFDAATFEIWGALLNGAKLILLDNDTLLSPALLSQSIKKNKITIMWLTVALFNQVIKAVPTAFKKLNCLLIGGEALNPSILYEMFKNHNNPKHVINGYGPTESTTFTTCFHIKKVKKDDVSIPIGTPIANTQVYVLDKYLQPMPACIPGELYIGGDGLAREYLNKPKFTQNRFVKNPFNKDENSKLYKTGDLVRWLPNGNIDYIGRLDKQVKIRGYRIELSEIEHNLCSLSDVSQAIVIVTEDKCNSKNIVAYIVTKPKCKLSTKIIYQKLKNKLPCYMMPSTVIFLNHIPLTPNGKIDHKALPAIYESNQMRDNCSNELMSDEEIILAKIWSEILRIPCDQISKNNNFYELGGHSLLAIRIITRISSAFNIDINASELYSAPTIEKLAKIVLGKKNNKSRFELVCVDDKNNIPLSFEQRRLWLTQQLEPNNTSYHLPRLFHIYGDLDIDALQITFITLLQRHEILRTNFTNDDTPHQIIRNLHDINFTLNIIDAKNYSQHAIQDMIYRDIHAPFNLSNDLLVRVKLYKLKANEYFLFLNIHHIIIDGWSYDCLYRELSLIYKSMINNSKIPLKPLKIQYADYTMWQKKRLDRKVLAKQLNYWKRQLTELPQLELPTDHLRPSRQKFHGRHKMFTISKKMLNELKILTTKAQTSLFTMLFSAFQILLSRYSGQKDFAIGTAVACRHHQALENLIGFFVNTLVLRGNLTNDLTFTDVLKRNEQIIHDAYNNQDVPFDKIVELLAKNNDHSRHPIFQALFVLNQFKYRYPKLSNLKVIPEYIDTDSSKVDIALSADVTSKGLICILEYNTDLFNSDTMLKFIEHYKILLRNIIKHENQSINQLQFITAAERNNIFKVWNNTSKNYQTSNVLHYIFEEQVRTNPDRIAVKFCGESLSYRELNARANCLAHYLRKMNVTSNSIVAISLERSFDMIVGILGILKAGGAYMPIDPTYPLARSEYILNNSGTKLVLTKACYLTIFEQFNLNIIALDKNWIDISKCKTENPIKINKPSDLAYIIYTSGTTGKPKGVMCGHLGICNRLLWMQDEYNLTQNDRVLQKTTFCFDVSVWEFFWPLITGARLVISKPGGNKDTSYIREVINYEKITTLHFVPPLLEVFLQHDDFSECKSLKLILCSGQTLPFKVVNEFKTKFPHTMIHNLYGPTEASIDVTAWDCSTHISKNIIPIGRPIANTQVYVLDEHLNLQPVGIPGELYIAGVGLAHGYINNPLLTNERFIPNLFSNNSNAKLYKTGDLVKWLPDGNIEYINRLDDQVKIRGFRIELGEIEACLLQMPQIKECIVLAKGELENRFLAAYIVLEQKYINISKNDINVYLQRHLPDYMAPQIIISIKKMPTNSNGKIDKKALPEPRFDTDRDDKEYIAPKTKIQKSIAQIWCEILKIKKLGINDNFFDHGGHSILALRALSKINNLFSIKLNVRTLLDSPTIADFSTVVESYLNDSKVLQNAKKVKNNDSRYNLALVELRKDGKKEPLFLFHSVGGTVFWYIPLVKYLDSSRPIYALQDPSIDKDRLIYTSIKEMASIYLAELRKIQPSGPYFLGGFSAGSITAVEVARQLAELGEEIKYLAFFDGWAFYPDDINNREFFEANMRRQYNNMKSKYIELGISNNTTLIDLQWQRAQLYMQYKIPTINTKITLFKANNILPMYQPIDNPYNCWQAFTTKPIDVHLIPGDHETIFSEPNIKILGDKMNISLDELDCKIAYKHSDSIETVKTLNRTHENTIKDIYGQILQKHKQQGAESLVF